MNVYQARLELEEVVGRLAAERFLPSHFDTLDHISQACDRLSGEKDTEALADIDFSIKAVFLEAAGNPFLKETSDRLYALTFRLWYFNMLNMNAEDWNIEVAAVKKKLWRPRRCWFRTIPRKLAWLANGIFWTISNASAPSFWDFPSAPLYDQQEAGHVAAVRTTIQPANSIFI